MISGQFNDYSNTNPTTTLPGEHRIVFSSDISYEGPVGDTVEGLSFAITLEPDNTGSSIPYLHIAPLELSMGEQIGGDVTHIHVQEQLADGSWLTMVKGTMYR